MTRTVVFLCALGTAASAAAGPLTLAPHIASHMVIQHGKPAMFRGGGASAGEAVTVRFNDVHATARADKTGRWQVSLPALQPRQAGNVLIRSASGETLQIDDVVTGDVWLCSGQSNMDLPVSDSANPERTKRESSGLPVRLLKVQRTASVTAAQEIVPEIKWSRAAPDALGSFSAACWHMARQILKHDSKTPLGLIQAAWGGSTIEDWMSPGALRSAGTPAAELAWLDRYAADPSATLTAAVEATDRWAERVDPGSASAVWASPSLDLQQWGHINVPGQWERSGLPGLSGYDGVMWFRTIVNLTPEEAAVPATLQLGRIDERDKVWINGVPIGSQLRSTELRNYKVPTRLLKAGENSIAVRVIDEMGGGGFGGPPQSMGLMLASGQRKALTGEWRYRRGAADTEWRGFPPSVPWSMPRGLAMAWNGMIAPLAGVQLRGVAWYQGESNTSRAADYGRALRSWRISWREHFDNAALPVVLVQLPSFGPRSMKPVDAPWARLREVQRLAALEDAATGLAVAIDLGIPGDIHPAHKDVVGQRMGQEALRIAYGAAQPAPPHPVEAVRTPEGIEITFQPIGTALEVAGAAEPAAFELCDVAGKCRFARAKVTNQKVVIIEDGGPAQEIRYAWQGSPPINLYAATGIPVPPFRLVVRPGVQ